MSAASTTAFTLPSGAEKPRVHRRAVHARAMGPIAHEHLHRYLFALQFCEGMHVLDVASGEGYGTFLLSRVARSVVGWTYRRRQSPTRPSDTARTISGIASATVPRFLFPTRRSTWSSASRIRWSISREAQSLHVRGSPGSPAVRAVRDLVARPDDVLPPGKPPNPFHVRELTAAEFESLVSRYFNHAVYGGQRATAGSLLLPVRGSPEKLECFSGAEPSRLERRGTLESPLYVIAVASPSPLPPVRWSVLDDAGYVPQLLECIDTLRQDNGGLAGALARKDR